jgi:lysophospholipid acyltransferase (LPLAT)-like uncharacterized protein
MRVRDWLQGRASAVAAAVAAGWVALCWRTTRWRVEGGERTAQMAAFPRGFIASFWHGRVAFSPLWTAPGRRTWAIVSANRDGEVIAQAVRWFGIELIRGSTADPRKPGKDKGGRAAMVASLRALRAGDCLAISPDGPRGPRMRAQGGVAALSAAAGVPVVPISWATRRGIRFDTWDRFVWPMPFDRGVLIYGEPIPAPASGDPATLEAHLKLIETALNAQTARAELALGLSPVEPDPLPGTAA